MRPYVTVYEKTTGQGQQVFIATLDEFLATGNYTTEKPSNGSEPAPTHKKPSAGREVSRTDLSEVYEQEAKEAAAPAVEEAEEPAAPAKSAPRRRAKASDAE